MRPVSIFVLYASATLTAAQLLGGAAKPFPTQSFKSSSAIAPKLDIHKSGQPLAAGYLFFSPEGGDYDRGTIMTDDGELIYSGGGGNNFGVQTLHDKKVIVRFTGLASGRGFAYGRVNIMDNTYKQTHTVCPKLGLFIPPFPGHTAGRMPACEGDLHESFVTNRGTVVVTAYNVTTTDLRPVGGPRDGHVIDGQFYEIDIKTNKILFKWSSLQHVPVTKTQVPVRLAGIVAIDPFDYFHINSVQPLDDGRFLVNSRQCSAMFLINRKGKIIWEFNGYNGGDFGPLPKLPNGEANFSFQHHARVQKITKDEVIVHFFNNNNPTPRTKNQSNGKRYRLDLKTMTSHFVNSFHDAKSPIMSYAEGDFQTLPNGNTLVAYGTAPIFQEFGPNGNTDVRMSVRFGNDGTEMDYRSYRQEWHATPHTQPSVAVQNGKGYVSWNGATDVTRYDVYTGKSKNKLKRTARIAKKGFETEFHVPKTGFVKVAAFEGAKRVRDSKVVQIK